MRHFFPPLALCLLPALAACKSDPSAATATSAAPAMTAPTLAPPPVTAHAAAATPLPAAPSAPATGAACSVVGNWTGLYPPGPFPFSGTPLDVALAADGTGSTKSQRADTKIAWHMNGPSLSFHGTETTALGHFTCRKEDEGRYSLAYSADCSSVTLGLLADPCIGRGKASNGIVLKRK